MKVQEFSQIIMMLLINKYYNQKIKLHLKFLIVHEHYLHLIIKGYLLNLKCILKIYLIIFILLNSRRNSNVAINLQPTTITLDLQSLTPTFPILPLVSNVSSLISNEKFDKNIYHNTKFRYNPSNYTQYKYNDDKKMHESINQLLRSNTYINSIEYTRFK